MRRRHRRYHAPPLGVPMAGIHITDIEAAINYWRERKLSPDGVTLAPELRALAEVYALMVYHRQDEAAEHEAWRFNRYAERAREAASAPASPPQD